MSSSDGAMASLDSVALKLRANDLKDFCVGHREMSSRLHYPGAPGGRIVSPPFHEGRLVAAASQAMDTPRS